MLKAIFQRKSAHIPPNKPPIVTRNIPEHNSFARSAPSDRRIVFKIHPMERGHNNLTSLIFSTAEAHDVSERVDIIECGSLGHLAHHCAGMITINSSSGFSAIYHGVPLMTLGEAVYTHPELVICAKGKPDFDAFWTSDHVADANTRKTYIAWVKESALKLGDFYSQQGMETACEAVLSKIEKQNLLHSPKSIKLEAS